tara:strand:+ start:483 stop:1571 length:1089 start_codon:yes stop_codon:yes gene_type:complete
MKQTKICLNAMVANESNTILRMLESCYQYIDYWVIQDNGSTDGTQQIIRDFFEEKGIDGFLYETEWEFPGYNRDHTLQKCLSSNHGCDWILRMDADEQLKVDEDFDWSIFNDTSIDSFNIPVDSGDSYYYRTWLWNANRPWYFKHSKRHETIHLPDVDEDFVRIPLPKSFRHIVTNDGQTWTVDNKFITDALTLELENVPTKKVLEDDYHLWYIGKSYYDGYWKTEELPFGELHSYEYARRAIFYFEMYLKKVHGENPHLDEMAYYGCLLLGRLYAFLGKPYDGLQKWEEAEKYCQGRNEHLIDLANYYRDNGFWEQMLEVCTKIMKNKNPFPNCTFFIDNQSYPDTGTRCKELFEVAKRNV